MFNACNFYIYQCICFGYIYLYNKTRHSYIYIYMLPIAGQTVSKRNRADANHSAAYLLFD